MKLQNTQLSLSCRMQILELHVSDTEYIELYNNLKDDFISLC